MKKILAIVLSTVFIIGIFSLSVSASSVFFLEAKNIDLPIVGAKPDFSADVGNSSTAYKITLVEWVEYDSGWDWQKEMGPEDTFKEGHHYIVYVHFEATSENSFAQSVSCKINATNAKLSGNSTQANGTKACFYTSYEPVKIQNDISKVELNVINPVIGKYPTFAKVDTEQYFSEKYGSVSNCSNGVTWTNEASDVNITINNKFKENVSYKVTYYLIAKDGYKFTYDTKCIINGISADIEVKDHHHAVASLSGIVPSDGKEEISELYLYVPAPKDGEKPDYTKIDDMGYYSDNGFNGTSTRIYKNGIAWYKSESSYISPGTTETFKENAEYTVKIVLKAKDGYKFSSSLSAKINGNNARIETFEDGSIGVSAPLTATAKHEHTPSDWRVTQVYHYKVCTSCGEMLEDEDHKGGVATCAERGVCTVCGYEYVEMHENHTPDTSKWVPRVDMYHFHRCTLCGAHVDIEDHRWSSTYLYMDATGHAWICEDCGGHSAVEKHVPGPAGTPGAAVVCRDCDYIITPAESHIHNLTKTAKKDATCTVAGNIEYYTCDGCSDIFADGEGREKITETVIIPTGHSASEEWKYDENAHWHICEVCNEILNETKSEHGETNDKCGVCGYEKKQSDAPVGTDPSKPQGDKNEKDDNDGKKDDETDGDKPWLTPVIVGVGAIGIGAIVGILILAIVMIIIKKRKAEKE